MKLRQIVRRLLTTNPRAVCDDVAPTKDIQVKQPDAEELAAGHREWRYQIHRNRNQTTISMQIAHRMDRAAQRMERASATALSAANELIAQLQKAQERGH